MELMWDMQGWLAEGGKRSLLGHSSPQMGEQTNMAVHNPEEKRLEWRVSHLGSKGAGEGT